MTSDVLSKAERVNAITELRSQARQRFGELEALYWKVNFSIWGFLGAVGYLLRGQVVPERFKWWSLILLAAIPLHFAFLRRIVISQSGWRNAATGLEDEARSLLGLAPPQRPLPGETDRNDQVWIRLIMLTTTMIAGAVIAVTLLVR